MRSCNRHVDCDEADRMATIIYLQWIAKGRPVNPVRPFYEPSGRVEHCYDPCCEDCFGH